MTNENGRTMTDEQLEFLVDAALRVSSAIAMELGIEPERIAARYLGENPMDFFVSIMRTVQENAEQHQDAAH